MLVYYLHTPSAKISWYVSKVEIKIGFQSVGILCVSETKALESLRSVLKLDNDRNHQGTVENADERIVYSPRSTTAAACRLLRMTLGSLTSQHRALRRESSGHRQQEKELLLSCNCWEAWGKATSGWGEAAWRSRATCTHEVRSTFQTCPQHQQQRNDKYL